jgi:hypothetical protein
MKLGYACINESLKRKFRTCRIQTFRIEGDEKIKELTQVKHLKRIGVIMIILVKKTLIN